MGYYSGWSGEAGIGATDEAVESGLAGKVKDEAETGSVIGCSKAFPFELRESSGDDGAAWRAAVGWGLSGAPGVAGAVVGRSSSGA